MIQQLYSHLYALLWTVCHHAAALCRHITALWRFVVPFLKTPQVRGKR